MFWCSRQPLVFDCALSEHARFPHQQLAECRSSKRPLLQQPQGTDTPTTLTAVHREICFAHKASSQIWMHPLPGVRQFTSTACTKAQVPLVLWLQEAGYCCRGSDGSGAVMRLPGAAQDDLWSAVNRGDGAAVQAVMGQLRMQPTQVSAAPTASASSVATPSPGWQLPDTWCIFAA